MMLASTSHSAHAGCPVRLCAGRHGCPLPEIVGRETRPFSDRDEAIKAAISLGGRAVERAA